ncbi:hypothetical protein [Subtercola sp. RTI3]|uniref:hypothetical protein n=1 Tax=Subtercola sp. RTI3 TaxID=3048639 RepID=UPI002B232A43|nr:hypothetical protein [Subtercola sp. RTI3]MEA9984917.1 hypothetical protein [Subtercola sp. RTI3]
MRAIAGMVSALVVAAILGTVGPAFAGTEVMPPTHAVARADVGTGTISGVVRGTDGQPKNNVEVYVWAIDGSGVETNGHAMRSGDQQSADGLFTFSGLPAADNYYVKFFDETWYQTRTLEWFGSTVVNQRGTPVIVIAGQTQSLDYTLRGTGELDTSIGIGNGCYGCSVPADIQNFSWSLLVYDDSSSSWRNVTLREDPVAVSSYPIHNFNFLYPGRYQVIVDYSGSATVGRHAVAPEVIVQRYDVVQLSVNLSQLIAPVAGVRVDVNAEVTALYADFLGRRPSASDIVFWSKSVGASGDYSLVAQGFVTSEEYRLIRIDKAYNTILGRPPEAAGRLNWLHAMQAGVLTTDDIERSFYSSDEYFQRAANNTPTVFMQRLYVTLLNRSGSPSEWAFWVQMIAEHGRTWVIDQLWQAPEVLEQRVTGMYRAYLGRDPDHDGLQMWAIRARTQGDTALRVSFSGSQEYFNRAQTRFTDV